MKLTASSTYSGRQDTGMEGDFTVNPWKHDRITSERNPGLEAFPSAQKALTYLSLG